MKSYWHIGCIAMVSIFLTVLHSLFTAFSLRISFLSLLLTCWLFSSIFSWWAMSHTLQLYGFSPSVVRKTYVNSFTCPCFSYIYAHIWTHILVYLDFYILFYLNHHVYIVFFSLYELLCSRYLFIYICISAFFVTVLPMA